MASFPEIVNITHFILREQSYTTLPFTYFVAHKKS